MRLATPIATLLAMTASPLQAQFAYPPTPTREQVDELHGVRVEDPYRWLENDVRTDPRVAEWVAAQNRVTSAVLESIPARASIRKRLVELFDYERIGAPMRVGERYAFTRNDGLQNQSVLLVQDALDAEARVLLDPNTWSEDGTIALSGLSFSPSGRLLAFAQSEAGSDWRRWRVLEVETGAWLDDEIRWVKWGDAAWTLDERGFFYARFPQPKEGAEFQSTNLDSSIWHHRLGTPQSEDVLVYENRDRPTLGFAPTVTEDGRYLLIYGFEGTDPRNLLLVRDLADPYAFPVAIAADLANEWSVLGNDGTTFYVKTDLDAPRGRIMAFDLREGLSSLREIVPQQPQVLESAGMVGDLIVAQYLRDVLPLVRLHRTDGSIAREIDLPGIGAAVGFRGKRRDRETFYTYASFDRAPSIHRLCIDSGESTPFRTASVAFDPEAYEVGQVFLPSKDGTRVPMFIAHRRGLVRDGSNPTLLYGYGGFNVSLTPWFSPAVLAWLEMGGVYAMANIRGGGEYGLEWHEAAKGPRRQNAFDDFIAAAEFLCREGWTRPDRLAIQGGSNGGLLVGAAMTQRPELFAAALPDVGVMDMLRFHLFTAGRYWTDDYGSPEDPEAFAALLAYSPYHNLRPGVRYPATMVTTADTDDRVVPGHSFKFAARLQASHAGDAPVLIRIESAAGHGAGTPLSKIIDQYADTWAFLASVLGMEGGQ